MAKDISLVLPKQNDLGAIFISNLQAAKSLRVLKEHRIGAIITVTKETQLIKENLFIARYLHLPAQDRDDFNIFQYFQTSYSFIQDARKVTNVLVHCIAGISRSATIVAAYMMKKYSMSSQMAISQLQKRREKISPNKGFRKQLQLVRYAKSSQKLKKEPFFMSPIKIKMAMTRSMPKERLSTELTKRSFQQKLEMSTVLKKQNPPPANMMQSIQLDKKQKIVKKIEKIKMSLVSQLRDTQDIKRKVKTTEAQPISFLHVLQNKIYQNKLKMKTSEAT